MATKSMIKTLKYYRDQGYRCEIVEHFISFGPKDARRRFAPGMRVDLMGIIDILVLDPSRGFIGVQACGQDFAAHLKKMLTEKRKECIDWLSTPGGHLVLIGWRKLKVKRGGKAMRWTPRIQEITLNDFMEVAK